MRLRMVKRLIAGILLQISLSSAINDKRSSARQRSTRSKASSMEQPALFLSESPEYPVYSQSLKQDILKYNWQVDFENELIKVEVTFNQLFSGKDSSQLIKENHNENKQERPINEWVAIGFSNYGEFDNADFCVFWMDWKGRAHLQDVYTTKNSTRLILDKDSQDCNNFQAQFLIGSGETTGNVEGIVWSFTRKFETCTKNSEEDYNIEDGTTHLIWSYGNGPLYRLTGVDVKDPSTSINGLSRLRLLKPIPDSVEEEEDLDILDIQHSEIRLPDDDTTYWCSVHKLPAKYIHKHHSIQYEPIIKSGNEHLVHHMEVFHCIPSLNDDLKETDEFTEDALEEFPIWAGPCGSDDAPAKLGQCKKVLAAWAIGAGPFTYPKETGLAIGGDTFSQYVMLEVHFNNPQMIKGITDNSGMRFHVTQNVRQFDAGIIELGLVYSDRMAIPPGMEKFKLDGYCLPECTATGFPVNGITIFGSQLHTHGSGIKVSTKHYRDGIELAELNRDDHYSAHFQEIRLLHTPRKILPGDNLITTCWHNTKDRLNVTVGGFTFADEMCVNYVHYFPRTEELEICKSAISESELDAYFLQLNKLEDMQTNIEKGSENATKNYHAIEWTPKRALELSQLYSDAHVSMQCQSGNGVQLPGDWTSLTTPAIKKKLLPTESRCDFDDGLKTTDITNDRKVLESSNDKKILEITEQRKKKRVSPPTQSKIIAEGNGQFIDLSAVGEMESSTLEHDTNTYKLKKASNLDLDRKKSAPSEVVKRLILKEHGMKKRIGHPMNEMKRRNKNIKNNLLTAKNKHDTLLKNAINALEQLRSSEQDVLMMKKRSALNEATNNMPLSNKMQRKRRNKKRTLMHIVKRNLGNEDETELEDGLKDDGLTSNSEELEEEPYDYSQDWSEYDWWGFDGLESRKKRSDRKKKKIKTTNIFSQNKETYENRKRRRLGSMR